jgi:hypothetical protein
MLGIRIVTGRPDSRKRDRSSLELWTGFTLLELLGILLQASIAHGTGILRDRPLLDLEPVRAIQGKGNLDVAAG